VSAVGIRAIAAYVPPDRVDLRGELARYGVTEAFLEKKTGCVSLARKAAAQDTSDLAVAALERLRAAQPEAFARIGLLAVVTQNPDGHGLPHTSALVHGKLGLGHHVAAFDISLGCSGWVYGLSVCKALMESEGIEAGVLLTADPYSKVIDPDDRDTALLFGDAATATLICAKAPRWRIGRFTFGTDGSQAGALERRADGRLRMNGRAVFAFSAVVVPKCIEETLQRNGVTLDSVDRVVLHQGSRYIVEFIGEKIGAPQKTPFLAREIGNTVSSTIPLIFAEGHCDADRRILVAGFGVGLSWAATILERV